MADAAQNDLPKLLVSAADRPAAINLIKEITRNSQVEEIAGGYLWTIKNKYYEAKVGIYISTDEDPITIYSPNAHVIFLQNLKGEGVERADMRAAHIVSGDGVRLVACEASPAPSALAAWACRHYYELVELDETAPSDSDDEQFSEQFGVARVVGALHAHTWPGLRRIHYFHGATSAPLTSQSYDDEEGQLECAEWFAELLGQVGAGRAAASTARSDEERRAHAEFLVTSFCSALGVSPDKL